MENEVLVDLSMQLFQEYESKEEPYEAFIIFLNASWLCYVTMAKRNRSRKILTLNEFIETIPQIYDFCIALNLKEKNSNNS